ncbi:MAG: IS630 family transposase [Chitinophagales bacterium]
MADGGADFVCNMENVLDVYERPYDKDNPVVNLDESPKQLIEKTRESFTNDKGVIHEDYEYKRNGVADMYMVVEPKGAKREVLVKDNHNSKTYAEVIKHIAENMYPNAQKITIVEDNLSAHKLSSLYDILEPHKARNIIKRIEIVRTPKHGSWLNIAEIELSILTRQGVTKHVKTKEELIEQVTEWYQVRNQKNVGVDWTFTTKDARIKLKRLYPTFKS